MMKEKISYLQILHTSECLQAQAPNVPCTMGDFTLYC